MNKEINYEKEESWRKNSKMKINNTTENYTESTPNQNTRKKNNKHLLNKVRFLENREIMDVYPENINTISSRYEKIEKVLKYGGLNNWPVMIFI